MLDEEVAPVVLRLLSYALVEIRHAAHLGDAERARRLSDALHNAPAALISTNGRAVLADVEKRCARHGESAWFESALQQAGEPDE